MAFPFETNEAIIKFIAVDDDALFSSIKGCSLVSRSLLLHTRKYIFKVVTLKPKDDHEVPAYTPLRFTRLISRNPEIAQYIRTLDYTMAKLDSDIKGLAAALGSLTRLESLKLDTEMYLGHLHMHWVHIPFPETILTLMQLPTLTHLKLCSIGSFSVSNLTLCTGLKFLEAGYLDVPRIGEKIESYQDEPPSLESFVGMPYNDPNFLKKLCTARRTDGKSVIDISELKKLSVNVYETPEEDTLAFFRCCTRLVDVYLAGCQSLLPGLGFADSFRPSIQTLQHIHVELDVCQDNEDPLPQLAPEFASLTGNNIIESIKISVFISLPTDYNAPGDEWSALNSVFTESKSGWVKLQRLSLHITVLLNDSEDEAEELQAALRELPETHLADLVADPAEMIEFLD